MPYTYLEHVADIGILGTGATLAEAFESAAQGLLELQVEPWSIEERDEVTTEARADDIEGLLVAFLNAILAEQDISRRFFRSANVVSLEQDANGWHITAILRGEPIDLARHVVASEVKAATYSGLSVSVAEGQACVRCVLDL